MILVALATRAALILCAPRPFGYVWDLYHEGVLVLYDQGRLPCATDCWECYPPPLYFILGVPFYALGKLLSGGAAAGGLRLLAAASMVCGGAAAWFCVKTVDLFRPSKQEALLAAALVLVFPCLFIGSFAAESDILLTALMSAFFYRLCVYHLNPGGDSSRGALVLGVLAGLSALTKYSGLLALPAAGAVMGLRALRGRRPWRAVRDCAAVFTVAGAIAGWHYAGNLRSAGKVFLQPPWLSNASSFRSVSQNFGRYDFASFRLEDVVDVFRPERPGSLDGFKAYRSVLASLYATAWTDMAFFSLPARQPWRLPIHYGEGSTVPMVVRTPAGTVRVAAYPEKRIRLPLVTLLLRAGVIPGALALIGFCATLRRRALQPFVLFSAGTMAAYFWWLLGQDSWAIKAKYVLFLLPAFVVYTTLGLRVLGRLDRRLGLAAAWALAAAIAVSEAYLLMFAFG